MFMSMDYERELTAIATTVEPPDQQVSPEAITIATESLYAIDAKYGPDSDHPLTFHNGPHSLGVTRRVIRFTNMLYPHIRPMYRTGIYDLGMIDGGTHDYEQLLGPGKNEEASGQYAVEQVEAIGTAAMNTKTFQKRLVDGNQATAVVMKEDGEIVQVNVQTGSHDPLKFITSFGDINGIAMEGRRRMLNDATRLAYEIYGEPTLDQLYNFLVNQSFFLRKRLNDGRVKSDIAYYFPDDIDEVYKVMRKAFHSNIVAAHTMALGFGKRPVAIAARGLCALDRSILGNSISKTLYGALTIPN